MTSVTEKKDPYIWVTGYEQHTEGQAISIYPVQDRSLSYERIVSFSSEDEVPPAGDTFKIVSPNLGFEGLEYAWQQTTEFPVQLYICANVKLFLQNTVPSGMMTDHSMRNSDWIVRNYDIPIEVWVGNEVTKFRIWFHVETSK